MRTEYNGKSIEYIGLTCNSLIDNVVFKGTTLYFKDDKGNYHFGTQDETTIWVMNQNDKFQNIENFYNGLKYIDEMRESRTRDNLLQFVTDMKGNTLPTHSRNESFEIAFICELGCWKNSAVRRSYLYDEEFFKYAKRCMREYDRVLHFKP